MAFQSQDATLSLPSSSSSSARSAIESDRISTVLVTGGNGFLALHAIKQLLESGRTVHTTVRKIDATAAKYAPLFQLSAQYPGKLVLFEADLTSGPNAFDAALAGGAVQGVLHVASPVVFTAANGQDDVVGPAVNGTVAVLEAASRAASVRRVIFTSSFAAVVDPTNENKTYTEADWNTHSKVGANPVDNYFASKTQAERAAWKFVEERKPHFTFATINPPYIWGDNINQASTAGELNASSSILLNYLAGGVQTIPDGGLAVVDVEDVARAHLLALDNAQATGRFLVSGGSLTYNELAAILRELYPTYRVPTVVTNADAGKPVLDTTKATQVLGLKYRPVKEAIRRQSESIIRMGLVGPAN